MEEGVDLPVFSLSRSHKWLVEVYGDSILNSMTGLYRGVLTVVESMNTDLSICLLSAPNNYRK